MADLTRRELLETGAIASGAVLLGGTPGWARKRPPGLVRGARFPSGVIAGEPRLHGSILMTQLQPGHAGGRLEVEVAADPGFNRVVHRRLVRAQPGADLLVKANVVSRRMKPGERYWYRFTGRDGSSPAGRFTTRRPAGSRERVRIGFFSCQDYAEGFFNAHAALAREDCDVIVSLGDYIYETNRSGPNGRVDRTSAGDNGECELLGEYRAKYRLYRADRDLRAMHASANFLASWDDHEVEDNHAGANGGKTFDIPVERRIPYESRRRNAYRAFFEGMPMGIFGEDRNRLYRRISLGGLVELFILDERQYRDDQPCNDSPALPCLTGDRDLPRTMLGGAQKRWLIERLARSKAAWKVLASGVEWMGWDIAPALIPANPDGWDGYTRERREVGDALLARGVRDVVILTGDVHHFAAGTVTTDGRLSGRPFATEFVGGAITSEFIAGPLSPAVNSTLALNPHMALLEFTRRGYGVLDVTPGEARVRYRSPRSVRDRASAVDTIATMRVSRGRTVVERV